MKITIKPLKGETFEIDIDGEEKIKDLKIKVAAVKSDLEPEQTKIIHTGKILTDDLVVKDCNIKPGEFVVVMSTKPKAEPKPPPMEAPTTMQADSNLVQGAGSEAAIANLVAMGFPREDVERCLRAAFGNPDRAVEYLMNGIPEGGEGDTSDDAPMPPSTAPTTGSSPYPAVPTGTAFPALPTAPTGGTTTSGGNADMLAELRNLPRFDELARMITANPAVLAQVLPALQQSHPALAEAIRANPEQFMRVLQERATPLDPVATMLRAVQQGQAPGGGTGVRPPGQVVRLSEEDAAAVGRLEALGFERNAAAQAYFACEKNEEAAANFLLSDMQD